MEGIILEKLENQISTAVPSAHAFLVRYLKAARAVEDEKIVQLSRFVLEGTLQIYNMLQYLPSQLLIQFDEKIFQLSSFVLEGTLNSYSTRCCSTSLTS